jgi:hypothetical protein
MTQACSTFCVVFLGMISHDKDLMSKVLFNDEAHFHVSDKVNTDNSNILALQNPTTSAELLTP